MEKNDNKQLLNDEVSSIMESIKIIDEQIKYFKKIKPIIFKKNSIRVNDLECIKKYLFKRLESKLNEKNYLR